MSFQVNNNSINIVHESKLYKDTYVPNKTRSKYESALDIFLKNKYLYEYTSFTSNSYAIDPTITMIISK